MPTSLCLAGCALLAGVLPAAFRLIWEMTILSWRHGPQMIGFALIHGYALLAAVGGLFWLGGIVWLTVVAVGTLAGTYRLSMRDGILVAAEAVILVCPVIPYSVWQSITESLLGASPEAPRHLVYAASVGGLRQVKRLIGRGVNPDSTNEHGCSPLPLAAVGQAEIVRLLIAHGANIHATCDGDTPLHRAATEGDLESTKLLLEAGADPSEENARGFTAAGLAWAANHPRVVALLDSSGRK